MKTRNLSAILILLGLTLLLGSCAKNVSLQKKAASRLQKGDFETATLYAVQSLSLKPSNEKAQSILKEAYHKATEVRLKNIATLKMHQREDRWDDLVAEYLALEDMYAKIRSLPPLTNPSTGERLYFDLRNYETELTEARENAAEYHYQKGIHLSMNSGSPAQQKLAAAEFKKASQFIAGYKDSLARYEASRQKAIRRIAVMPFEDKSSMKSRYGAVADILADQIISAILQDTANTEFIEIITRDQINKILAEQQLSTSGLVDENSAARIGKLLGAHEILSGRILQINYVAPRTASVDIEETAEIEVEKEDTLEKEKIEVSCLFTSFTKTASAQIVASYSLVDVSTGVIKTQESFTASTNFEKKWGRVVSGDRRALSAAVKDMINLPEPFPPSEKEMVNSSLNKLSTDIVKHFFRAIQ